MRVEIALRQEQLLGMETELEALRADALGRRDDLRRFEADGQSVAEQLAGDREQRGVQEAELIQETKELVASMAQCKKEAAERLQHVVSVGERELASLRSHIARLEGIASVEQEQLERAVRARAKAEREREEQVRRDENTRLELCAALEERHEECDAAKEREEELTKMLLELMGTIPGAKKKGVVGAL